MRGKDVIASFSKGSPGKLGRLTGSFPRLELQARRLSTLLSSTPSEQLSLLKPATSCENCIILWKKIREQASYFYAHPARATITFDSAAPMLAYTAC